MTKQRNRKARTFHAGGGFSSNSSSSSPSPNPNPLGGGMLQHIQQQQMSGGGKNKGILQEAWTYIHDHIMYLNNSKFFAGVIMILLNVGSKVIPVEFSKSASEYLKYSITKQLIVFAMAWMGTRDIYVSLVLTAVFVILSDHLFNEESSICVVPHRHRVLHKLIDTNNDGIVSEEEIKEAEKVLAKAKSEKMKKDQHDAFMKFNYQIVPK
jgi:hypothetical protein